ncbi:MAG: AbrB/MazE/SpoVT family DNA-binding domain-containing protein [Candidatus Bathyarchaeia archaeon]|jgi:AbrB family looped-hinge helix DNA binding protein
MVERKRDTHLYGTVKVGDRGQVVIPAEARKERDIKPGDLLFVMAGRNRRGVVMVKADAMRELAEKIMQGFEVAEKTET